MFFFGYVHEMNLEVRGHNLPSPPQLTAVTLTTHLYHLYQLGRQPASHSASVLRQYDTDVSYLYWPTDIAVPTVLWVSHLHTLLTGFLAGWLAGSLLMTSGCEISCLPSSVYTVWCSSRWRSEPVERTIRQRSN